MKLCKGKTRLGIYFKVKEANHLEVISFLKILRKACDEDEKNASTSSKFEKLHENPNIEENEKQFSNVSKVIYNEFKNTLERDPGKCLQIWQYPPNQIDEVRRAYLKWDSYQMHLTKDNFCFFFLYILLLMINFMLLFHIYYCYIVWILLS